jgi:tetratricopeptide (TPR) repeat protein
VVTAALLAHARALANGFAWDDRHTVVANPALRSLAALVRSFGMDDWEGYGLRARGLYRPLTTVSLWLDRLLSGEPAFGYHLTSLALHALTAIALLLVLRRADVRGVIAAAVAVLFAVHPLTAEVANWISARPDGLSTALAVGALLAAVRDRPILAAFLAVLAPWAKEPGLLAIPAVLTVTWSRAPRLRASVSTAVAAGGAAGYLLARHLAHVPSNEAVARLAHPAGWRTVLQGAGNALLGFAAAVMTPLPLDLGRRLPSHATAGLAAGLLLAFGTAAALAWCWRRRQPLTAAALLLVAGSLALVGAYGVNLSERYLYLPLAATTVLAALALEAAARRWPAVSEARPSLALRVVTAALVLCAAAADFARAGEWSDPLTLFGSAVQADAANPESWQLYGAELYRAGRRQEALAAFERSAALGSTQAGLYSNLCAVRRELGDLNRASGDCDRAVALDPGDPRPRYNRALLLAQLGRTAEAVAELRDLVRQHPGYTPARRALEAR